MVVEREVRLVLKKRSFRNNVAPGCFHLVPLHVRIQHRSRVACLVGR